MNARVNIYQGDTLVSWFDYDAIQGRWSVPDHNGRGEAVILTAQGRWVAEVWTQWEGEEDLYKYVTPEAAWEWLLRNNEDEAVEQHFGALEPERGPGRPEVGPRIQVRLEPDTLAELDQAAEAAGRSRADMVRQLVADGLEARA